ncbi:hypothetical protein Tco_1302421 [Tanacetum coccineum]
MEEASLITTQNTYSLLHNTTTDKHGVPLTKRLFKVAMLDPSPNLLVLEEGLEFWDNSTVPYGKTWVMVNGPDQRDFNLPEKIFNQELKRRT